MAYTTQNIEFHTVRLVCVKNSFSHFVVVLFSILIIIDAMRWWVRKNANLFLLIFLSQLNIIEKWSRTQFYSFLLSSTYVHKQNAMPCHAMHSNWLRQTIFFNCSTKEIEIQVENLKNIVSFLLTFSKWIFLSLKVYFENYERRAVVYAGFGMVTDIVRNSHVIKMNSHDTYTPFMNTFPYQTSEEKWTEEKNGEI